MYWVHNIAILIKIDLIFTWNIEIYLYLLIWVAWWPKNFFFFLRNLLFKRIHLHATLKLHARHQFIVDSHKNFFNRKSKRQRPQAASGRKSISKQDSQTRFENPEAKKNILVSRENKRQNQIWFQTKYYVSRQQKSSQKTKTSFFQTLTIPKKQFPPNRRSKVLSLADT